MTIELKERRVEPKEEPLQRIERKRQEDEAEALGTVNYAHYVVHLAPPPFKGRKTVESYPADWPYPDDEDAERLWDETEE
jgi:hypothetical protein